MNGVRYDSPVFAGFSVSASWGEDDFWEVAGRYAGEFGGFKVSAGVGFSRATDEATTGVLPGIGSGTQKGSEFFQIGGYLEHVATGLFLHGAYGHENNEDTQVFVGGLLRTPENSEHWYVKAGIRQKWNPLGATIVYGDYAEYLDQIGPALLAAGATSSELKRYGGGIAQEIDNAAMTVYLKYQRYEGSTNAVTLPDIDAIDFVSTGAIINF